MEPSTAPTRTGDPRSAYDRFVYTHCSIDGRDVALGYRLDGEQGAIDFVEKLKLPVDAGDLATHPAVIAALRGLHLMGGLSYWKASCPATIVLPDVVGDDDASYWNEVFTYGLGEFFFRNGLSPRDRFRIAATGDAPTRVRAPKRGQGALVLVGGGKDSAVSTEVARQVGGATTLLSVGAPPWIRSAVAASGFEHLVITRSIDARLFELNKAGAWNGHVPISAYIAHATLLVALIGGYDEVITSNERSASFGNVEIDGIEINHQWSKGLRFEQLFQSWVSRRIDDAPKYFSLLRPLSELRIARAFATHPRYFEAVTSCNANFKVDGKGAPKRWCGHCPKCVFVATMLAAVLPTEQLAKVFESDVLANPEAVPMLEELLGMRAHKPFECVGTPDETRAALFLAHRAGISATTDAMRFFVERVVPETNDPEALIREALSISSEHAMPPRWREALDVYLRDR